MDYDAALTLAEEKKLAVFLDFTGSDWCGWCKLMDRSVFIRQYTHTVPQFVRAFDASPDAPLPEAKPTIVIIFQSLQTLGPEVMYPSLPTLLALAKRTNTAAALREQFSQIDDALIAEGDAKLVSAGVLP